MTKQHTRLNHWRASDTSPCSLLKLCKSLTNIANKSSKRFWSSSDERLPLETDTADFWRFGVISAWFASMALPDILDNWWKDALYWKFKYKWLQVHQQKHAWFLHKPMQGSNFSNSPSITVNIFVCISVTCNHSKVALFTEEYSDYNNLTEWQRTCKFHQQ